jgi:hypothetical protein
MNHQIMPVSSVLSISARKRVTVRILVCAGALLQVIGSPLTAQCPPGWVPIGPSPLTTDANDGVDGLGPDSGVIRDIAINSGGSVDQTIFVATDNGGVWRTQDNGATWQAKTDFMPSLNMGSVALDPANLNIVYAGSGNELNQDYFKGAGLYKSTDGGENWTVLGANIFTNVAINRIVIAPNNVLLLGTGIGVYRSIDGGAHFGNNAPNFDNSSSIIAGDVTDLDLDTASGTTVYASIGSTGVFKSTDSGATFAAGNNLFTNTNGSPLSAGFSYVAFAQSTQPNNQTMYVNVALSTGRAGIYKSTNAGASWTSLPTNTGDLETVQAGYAQTVGIDPQDANRAYVGGRALYMTTNGWSSGVNAANRIDLAKVHADQHALVFSPSTHWSGTPTRIYNGTDGGIATTANGGTNWTLLNGPANCQGPNTALATTLFRQIDIGRGSTSNNAYTYGAAQDLGVSVHNPSCPATPWHIGKAVSGDGWSVAVDPNNGANAIVLTGSYFGTSDGGANWSGNATGISTFTTQPILWDPSGGNNVYAAVTNQLFRSTDRGATFTAIKTFTVTRLTVIDMVNTDSNTIWVGGTTGVVWHTSNASQGASATWTQAIVTGAPNQTVTGIALDPTNRSQVLVTYQGGGVFSTGDNGTTWTNITGSLGAANANAVVIDPNTSPHAAIVATESGVMQTADLGVTWQTVGVGLPHAFCSSLALDASAIPSLLRVGTYGRSAFELGYDRKYVDLRNSGQQDGTREHPYQTVGQAVNAAGNGSVRAIPIQSGTYHASPLTINQCTTLNAVGGVVSIN